METSFISFEDFAKVDLRVGQVVEAETVPKSKKLLKLAVKFGEVQKTVMAGISESFTPENIVGESFLFVVNIEPRKVMGILSEAMILACVDNNQQLLLCKMPGASGAKVG